MGSYQPKFTVFLECSRISSLIPRCLGQICEKCWVKFRLRKKHVTRKTHGLRVLMLEGCFFCQERPVAVWTIIGFWRYHIFRPYTISVSFEFVRYIYTLCHQNLQTYTIEDCETVSVITKTGIYESQKFAKNRSINPFHAEILDRWTKSCNS